MSADSSLDACVPMRKIINIQDNDLKGKVALVTGATKGIGRAIVIELATRGCSIIGTYSDPLSATLFDTLVDTVISLYNGTDFQPKLIGIVADITSPSAPSLILDALQRHFAGEIDIVVFNAAIMGLAVVGESFISQDFTSNILAGNVQFPIMMMEKLVNEKCIRKFGRVVAISSECVRARRPPGGSVYAATKAALECLMRQWADELGNRVGMQGTTFNSVSVGFTKTEAYHRIPTPIKDSLTSADAAEVSVANRIGEVDDIAGIVGLLVSERAGWTSGSVVDGTGGKSKIM